MSKQQKETAKAITFILFSVLLGVEGYFSYIDIFNKSTETPSEDVAVIEEKPNPFDTVDILGSHAIVYDITNDTILYEKDAYTSHPIASITKLVTALVSSEILGENQNILIDGNALAQDVDSGLMLYESWSFKDLLDFSLLVSSNDGAYAIASIAGSIKNTGTASIYNPDPESAVSSFVESMNNRMYQLGLQNTYFNNPSGLDENESEAGGYSTAFEIAKLFEYIVKNNYNVFEATSLQETQIISKNSFIHNATNTNASYPNIPGLLASKTGYTDLAGGNLAIVFDVGINHPVAVVVLDSTYYDRFDDVSELVAATNEYFAK